MLSLGGILAAGLFLVCLLAFPYAASEAALKGMTLCVKSVLPTLFPFMTAALLLTKLGLAEIAAAHLDTFMRRVFNVSGACAPAFVLGTLSGFPVGAKVISGIYERGGCSRLDAERTLAFCNAAGPAFVMGSVGATMFADSGAGVILWAVQLVCSVAIGVAFGRIRGSSGQGSVSVLPPRREPISLFKAFSESVTESLFSVLSVCAFVVFFSVFICICAQIGLFDAVSAAVCALLPVDPLIVEALCTGIIEMTSGVSMLADVCARTSASPVAAMAMVSAVLGWTGLCVHMQIFSCIRSAGLNGKLFVAGRVVQALVSSVASWAIFSVYYAYQDASCLSTGDMSDHSWVCGIGIFLMVCAAAACVCLLFIGRRGKARR